MERIIEMHSATILCLHNKARLELLNAHLTEETIENYEFNRLSIDERILFEAHAEVCSVCAVKLHNERLFIYAMKAALSRQPYENRDSTGATFAAAIV